MSTEELVLDPITDESGKELSAQDVIDAVEKPIRVEFTHDGMNFMAWVRRSQVTMQQWVRISTIQATIGFNAGFKAGEDMSDILPGDNRMIRMLELMNSSESLVEANADVALAATVRGGEKGYELLTNVPALRCDNEFEESPASLKQFLITTELGQAYVKAVLETLHPTSTPAEAEAATMTPANETECLTSLSSTNQENSQATGSFTL